MLTELYGQDAYRTLTKVLTNNFLLLGIFEHKVLNRVYTNWKVYISTCYCPFLYSRSMVVEQMSNHFTKAKVDKHFEIELIPCVMPVKKTPVNPVLKKYFCAVVQLAEMKDCFLVCMTIKNSFSFWTCLFIRGMKTELAFLLYLPTRHRRSRKIKPLTLTNI